MRTTLLAILLGCLAAAGCAETATSPRKSTEAPPDQPDAAQVAALIDNLQSGDDKVRRNAIDLLANLGPKAKPAVSALTEILKDKRAPFRSNAAIAFNQILPPHVDMLKLFPDLRYVGDMPPVDQWPADRRQKLAEAQEIANHEAAKAAEIAVPALIDALADEDAYVRQNAALSLGACGRLAGDSVPALIRTLKDEDEAVRIRAAEALGRIGTNAKAAIPSLLEYIERNKRYDVRSPAERAVEAIQATNKPLGHVL